MRVFRSSYFCLAIILALCTSGTNLYAQPRLTNPANTTLVADTLIQLSWSPLSNANMYEIAIGWDAAFTLPTVQTFVATEANLRIRRSALPFLRAELTAFWRVRARIDSANTGTWSEIWRFTMPKPKPKTEPPMLLNQINNRQLLTIRGNTPTLDKILLEAPLWRTDGKPGTVFLDSNKPMRTIEQEKQIRTRLTYNVQSDMSSVAQAWIDPFDSLLTFEDLFLGPTLWYQFNADSNSRCRTALITLTATNSFGWSTPCFFLIIPRMPIIPTEFHRVNGFGLRFDDVSPLNVGQMPITQSTVASFPINAASNATGGTLHLQATLGVEFSLSPSEQWQKSLRIDCQNGQPKPDSLWLRYIPQKIGQNFPVIRYETYDSCDLYKSYGILRLEALATQPQPYTYKTTSVKNEQNLYTNIEFRYTNPVSNEALFRLNIPKPARVKLTVLSLVGKTVEILANDKELSAGEHTFTWFTDGLPSGVYNYRLEINNGIRTGFINVVH